MQADDMEPYRYLQEHPTKEETRLSPINVKIGHKIYTQFLDHQKDRKSFREQLLGLSGRVRNNRVTEVRQKGKIDLGVCHFHEVLLYARRYDILSGLRQNESLSNF